MDAYAKLGSKYIPKDPHIMTPNGALLSGIIERQNLTVGNGSDKCEGVITRKRTSQNRVEQSAIDIVLFSGDLNKHFVGMTVDEKRNHVLTRISKTKKGVKIKESDHNVVLAEFTCKLKDSDKKDKPEVYILKNQECQANFKKYTSNTNMLSSTIDEQGDINKVIKRFMKKLEGFIAVNFRKRRVKSDKTNKDDSLYDRMRTLKNKDDKESKEELVQVMEAIGAASEENFLKLKDELNKIKPDGGKLDKRQIWKLKKKLCPNLRDPPCAMNDGHGNLITSEKSLREKALEVYTDRLKGNTIEPHLKVLEEDTNTLCEIRVRLAKSNKTPEWTMEDLKEVLKQLGKDKSRDPEGHSNELFKEEVAGTDLLTAVLKIMNMIKNSFFCGFGSVYIYLIIKFKGTVSLF